jgi:hypothetical protein
LIDCQRRMVKRQWIKRWQTVSVCCLQRGHRP